MTVLKWGEMKISSEFIYGPSKPYFVLCKMQFVQKFFGAVRSLRKHCVRSGSVAQAGSLPDIAEQFDSDGAFNVRPESKTGKRARKLPNTATLACRIAPVKR